MAQNKNKGLQDPVEGKGSDETLKEELSTLDPDAQTEDFMFLKPEEIGSIRDRQSASPHPFDNYRLGRKILVGETMVSSTFVVLLNPTSEPTVDKSNLNQTIYAGGDNTPKTGKPKVVNFETSHTRVVTDRTGTVNESVVFDREIVIGDGRKFKCAIVKSHAARSQICFAFDGKRNKVVTDKRYSLADVGQAQALYKMFSAVHYQRTNSERAAKEFDVAQESTAADKE